jgi:hypothetical protein
MLALALYLALGYLTAILAFWLAARRRPLPEGSSLAFPILVLCWPLVVLVLALGGADETR